MLIFLFKDVKTEFASDIKKFHVGIFSFIPFRTEHSVELTYIRGRKQKCRLHDIFVILSVCNYFFFFLRTTATIPAITTTAAATIPMITPT